MEVQTRQLTKMLDPYYAKLPVLPKGAVDFIVNVTPWVTLVLGVLALLGGVAAFGLLTALSPFAAVAGAGQPAVAGLLASLVLLVQGIIYLIAFSPLRARKVKGWNLLVWALVLSVVSSLFYLRIYGVVSSLFWALVGYYFLYQIRSSYK